MIEIISKLEQLIFENANKMNHPQLENDLSAMVFTATLYNYSKQYKYKERCKLMLDNFVEQFDSVEGVGLFSGFEGAISVINYLHKCNVIESKELIDDLEAFGIQSIIGDITRNNYDLMYGSIGKLLYFVQKGDLTEEIKKLLDDFIKSLYENSIKKNSAIFFYNDIDVEGVYNLGMAHGSSGVLVFLNRLIELEYTNPLIEVLISGIIKGLKDIKKENNSISCYAEVHSIEHSASPDSRLAWCYGDLGMLYSLLYASTIIDLSHIQDIIDDLLEAVVLRGISNSGLIHFDDHSFFDTSFCHGLSGITYLFYKIKQLTENEQVDKRFEYWRNELVKNLNVQLNYNENIHQPWWRQNKNQSNVIDAGSILHGFTGTGLVLLSLHYNRSDWSDMFLIF
jgi:lantibiotic modifying enzyme